MSKTHWKKLTNPDYLGAYSLDDGNGRYNEIVAKINKVVVEMVTGPDGKKEECTVAYLSGQKPMILNATNMKTLVKLFKSPYIEDWANKDITIGVEKIKAFGELVDALRIKKTLPAVSKPAPAVTPPASAVPSCSDCKGTIKPAGSRDAAGIARYTTEKYKRPLCGDCASKIAAQQNTPAEDEII